MLHDFYRHNLNQTAPPDVLTSFMIILRIHFVSPINFVNHTNALIHIIFVLI